VPRNGRSLSGGELEEERASRGWARSKAPVEKGPRRTGGQGPGRPPGEGLTMLSNHSGSYYEEYRRSKSKSASARALEKGGLGFEEEKLLTDRSAYITFLEVQLERVSAACLTSQSFSERIEEVRAQTINYEEKVQNLARAVKLCEQASETARSDCLEAASSSNGKLALFEKQLQRYDQQGAKAWETLADIKEKWNAFEEKHLEELDAARRRLEQKLLDVNSRLELDEARGRSNEGKITGLGELIRLETKSAVESLQTQVDVKVQASVERQELRLAALENRLGTTIDHLKSLALQDGAENTHDNGRGSGKRISFPADLVEGQLREEIESVKRSMQSQTEKTTLKIMETLRDLEARIEDGGSQDALMARLDRMESAMGKMHEENASLRAELADLKRSKKSAKSSPSSSSSSSSTAAKDGTGGAGGVDRDFVELLVQAAVNEQNSKIWDVLSVVESKIKQQSELLAESMQKVELFIDIYKDAQGELEDRLAQGRRNQDRISKLIEEGAMQSLKEEQGRDSAQKSAAFKVAFQELSDIVRETRAAKVRRKKKAVSRKKNVSTKPSRTRMSMSASRAKQASRPTTPSGSRAVRRRSSSAEPRSHERPTLSSIARGLSRTPFVYNYSEDEAAFVYGFSGGKDGGGKRGRGRSTSFTETSVELRDCLSDYDGEPFRARELPLTPSSTPAGFRSGSRSSGDPSRPAWNAGAGLKEDQSKDDFYEHNFEQRRRKLEKIYREASS